jgi:flagellar basal body-associated protein FliL
MPNSSLAEFYFIAAMMILILILCAAATFVFFRQLKREKRTDKTAKKQKPLAAENVRK